MPNIEIYGLKDSDGVKVAEKIDELFREKDYRDEYVLTYIQSYVCDRKGIVQPYLRLVTTPSDHMEDIIGELRKIGMDIEVSLLERFIPKA